MRIKCSKVEGIECTHLKTGICESGERETRKSVEQPVEYWPMLDGYKFMSMPTEEVGAWTHALGYMKAMEIQAKEIEQREGIDFPLKDCTADFVQIAVNSMPEGYTSPFIETAYGRGN